MLNNFISYIYEPYLPKTNYHGFIYNRGCKSWWEDTLWSNLTREYSYISEVDLSSGFPNCSLIKLRECLLSDSLIPPNLIDLILLHLRSPLKESSWFPNFTSFVENCKNKNWRKGYRSIHMGLGISPILFVILQNWCLKNINLQNNELKYKWFAVDGCLYFHLRGLTRFYDQQHEPYWKIVYSWLLGLDPLIRLLNELTILKESGIKLCEQKSKLVKINRIWVNPLQSLALKLTNPESIWTHLIHKYWDEQGENWLELSGNTRGKASNPKIRKSGTFGSKLPLKANLPSSHDRKSLETLLNHLKPYFGLIQSKLYSSESLGPDPRPLGNWGLIKPRSLLSSILKQRRKIKNSAYPIKLEPYTIGITINTILMQLSHKENLATQYEYLRRNLSQPWKSKVKNILSKEFLSMKVPSNYHYEQDYFDKYSELNLSVEEQQSLLIQYEDQKDQRKLKNT